MLTKFFVTLCVVALLFSSSNVAYSQTSDEKVSSDVAKRGTGEKAKVTVTTKAGVKRKGYITRADADSFDVRVEKTAQTETFRYTDVAKVKKPGWSKGAKIALGVGIGLAVTAVIFAVALDNALDDLGSFGIGNP